MIYNKRLTLIKEVSKQYNPTTKRTETVTEQIGDKPFPCQMSPITRQRELVTFGDTDVVTTVARFPQTLPDDVKYAEGHGSKYEVVDSRNYPMDGILYLKEVTDW